MCICKMSAKKFLKLYNDVCCYYWECSSCPIQEIHEGLFCEEILRKHPDEVIKVLKSSKKLLKEV